MNITNINAVKAINFEIFHSYKGLKGFSFFLEGGEVKSTEVTVDVMEDKRILLTIGDKTDFIPKEALFQFGMEIAQTTPQLIGNTEAMVLATAFTFAITAFLMTNGIDPTSAESWIAGVAEQFQTELSKVAKLAA